MTNIKEQYLQKFRERFFIEDGEISVEKIVDLEQFLSEALDAQREEVLKEVALKILPALIIDESEHEDDWYKNLQSVVKEALLKGKAQ